MSKTAIASLVIALSANSAMARVNSENGAPSEGSTVSLAQVIQAACMIQLPDEAVGALATATQQVADTQYDECMKQNHSVMHCQGD